MLTATDRTALASLAICLKPGADISPLTTFVESNREACLAELGDDSGLDQLRATIIRVLRDEAALTAVSDALETYADHLVEAGRSLLLRRHPAWVGLCRLELVGGPELASEEDITDAIRLANVGFAAAAEPSELADGEALWAMAEQAESVSWMDRFAVLMARAVRADFADPVHRAEVHLLFGLFQAERDDPEAEALLTVVAEDELAETQARVHAAWVLAHLQSDSDRALRWLEHALENLAENDDADVRRRIVDAIEKHGN